jgi:predicted TIM-barrel fold metal-dependent hydrolase
MTIFDGHIHINPGEPDPAGLVRRLGESGIQGGMLISLPPDSFGPPGRQSAFAARLDNLLAWTAGRENLFPVFWIDPLEKDAPDQVQLAADRGVDGFKVICNSFYPGDPRALQVFRRISARGKPILFHSGILWDGRASSRFNRPVFFESLLEVEALRFAMAHIAWPWCDELIAVYGKFLNAYDRDSRIAVQMFVDITPGTPPLYRRDALTSLFRVGYDVERNVIFGTDCNANEYNRGWAREWIQRDSGIYQELGLSEEAQNNIFSRNLRRFLGLEAAPGRPRSVRPGE